MSTTKPSYMVNPFDPPEPDETGVDIYGDYEDDDPIETDTENRSMVFDDEK